ncbi:hypothetical protein E1952_14920 [Staphylococcus aureus]|nr:hypothetical protein E1952_14920 [Staphylococcus aureus]
MSSVFRSVLPHSTYDYLLDLQSQTERVESVMSNRGQMRAVHQVKIDLAREFYKAERHDEVLQTLQPVWENMIWRREKWFDLAVEVLELIYDSAEKTGNIKLQAESAWELTYKRMCSPANANDLSNPQQPSSHRKQSIYRRACPSLAAMTSTCTS